MGNCGRSHPCRASGHRQDNVGHGTCEGGGWAFLSVNGAEIVFLDEADGILRDRQYSHYGMLTEKILTTMDGVGGRVRDVMFVAATNYCDRIDAATLRGGRFEEKIFFDVPAAADMAAYISSAFARVARNYRVSKSTVHLVTDCLTGRSIVDADAVIQKVIDAAAVRRLRERTCDIRPEDAKLAVATVLAARCARKYPANDHSLMKRFHKPGAEKQSVVIVRPDLYADWLGCRSTDEARSLLNLYPVDELAAEPTHECLSDGAGERLQLACAVQPAQT